MFLFSLSPLSHAFLFSLFLLCSAQFPKFPHSSYPMLPVDTYSGQGFCQGLFNFPSMDVSNGTTAPNGGVFHPVGKYMESEVVSGTNQYVFCTGMLDPNRASYNLISYLAVCGKGAKYVAVQTNLKYPLQYDIWNGNVFATQRYDNGKTEDGCYWYRMRLNFGAQKRRGVHFYVVNPEPSGRKAFPFRLYAYRYGQ